MKVDALRFREDHQIDRLSFIDIIAALRVSSAERVARRLPVVHSIPSRWYLLESKVQTKVPTVLGGFKWIVVTGRIRRYSFDSKRLERQATHSPRAPFWRTCWTSWSVEKLVLIAVSTFCSKTRRDSLWPPSTGIATSSWCILSRLSTSASSISLSSLTTIVFRKLSILKLKHEMLDRHLEINPVMSTVKPFAI